MEGHATRGTAESPDGRRTKAAKLAGRERSCLPGVVPTMVAGRMVFGWGRGRVPYLAAMARRHRRVREIGSGTIFHCNPNSVIQVILTCGSPPPTPDGVSPSSCDCGSSSFSKQVSGPSRMDDGVCPRVILTYCKSEVLNAISE